MVRGPKIILIGITVNNRRMHTPSHWQNNLYQWCSIWNIWSYASLEVIEMRGQCLSFLGSQWGNGLFVDCGKQTHPSSQPPSASRRRCSFSLPQPLSSWMHSWHWAVQRGQLLSSPFANEAIKSILPWCRRTAREEHGPSPPLLPQQTAQPSPWTSTEWPMIEREGKRSLSGARLCPTSRSRSTRLDSHAPCLMLFIWLLLLLIRCHVCVRGQTVTCG